MSDVCTEAVTAGNMQALMKCQRLHQELFKHVRKHVPSGPLVVRPEQSLTPKDKGKLENERKEEEPKRERENHKPSEAPQRSGPGALTPADDHWNPMTPPGVSNQRYDDKQDEGVKTRSNDETYTRRGGYDVKYQGTLDDSFGKTSFTSMDRYDYDHKWLFRETHYFGDNKMIFDAGNGHTVQIKNVTAVETTYDRKIDKCYTTIKTKDGLTYEAVISRRGVESMQLDLR